MSAPSPHQQPHPHQQPQSSPGQGNYPQQPYQQQSHGQQQSDWQQQSFPHQQAQGQQHAYSQQQAYQQQHGPSQPQPYHASAAGPGVPARPKAGPIGSLVMLLGVVLCILGTFLPWLAGSEWEDDPLGGIMSRSVMWNGWTWADAGRRAHNPLGMLLFLALGLALLGCLLVLVAVVRQLLGRHSPGWTGAGIFFGMLGTLGTIGAIVVLTLMEGKDGLGIFNIGCWLFAGSFLVVGLGAILNRSPRPRTGAQPEQSW